MSQLLYGIINPPISLLLQSPLHRLMSHNTLIINFKGRKSGKRMATPISYHRTDNRVHCFTARSGLWWKNLKSGAEVELLIQGSLITATPAVVTDEATITQALSDFLRAVPRDAAHSNVRLEKDGTPNPEDMRQSAGNLVLLTFIELGQAA